MLFASVAETWQPQKSMQAENIAHILFLYFVFHCETECAPGEPADNVNCSPFVLLL